MAADTSSPGNSQINQLNHARSLALEEPSMYSKLLPAILPILNPISNPSPDLRAWGADFLAEIFSSPALSSEEKQAMSVQALPVLKEFLELPTTSQPTSLDQTGMVKSAIQAAASVYPLVFRHIIRNPNDVQVWQTMAAIKSNILRRMDSELPGVRICCLRFVERVVQTQTPGVIADPRRPEQNEISLALVPPDHPLIPPSNLEAEAHGLLDRALSILQENHSDALLVTATLNGLGGLVRLRATVANKIVNAVLNFNPFKLANSPMTPASKLVIRSMEKTVCVFLQNVLKRAPQHPMASRIEQHIIRLQQMRKDILDGAGLKRPAIDEPTDGLDHAKRQRLGADVPAAAAPLLPAGPISYAQLFTLTVDPGAKGLNVRAIPAEMAARTLVHLLKFNVNKDELNHAINTIRGRYLSLSTQSQPAVQTNAPLDEEEDYEPEYQPPEDAEQIKNRLEMDSSEDSKPIRQSQDSVGVYRLPKPPPMTYEQVDLLALATLDRMFDTLAKLLVSQESSERRRAFPDSVITGAIDRKAYFRMIVRVAVRPVAGLEAIDNYGKPEKRPGGELSTSVSDHVRQRLLQFILSDWQHRIGNAVTWFTEEWLSEQAVWKDYTETLGSANRDPAGNPKPPEPPRHYKKWVLRFLDDLSAYLGGSKTDMKVLVRLMSEIPALDEDIVARVASLAEDPERVSIVAATLRYLIQYRPPAKEISLDALQTVWRYERSVEGPNTVMLRKLRPGFIEKALELSAAVKETEDASL